MDSSTTLVKNTINYHRITGLSLVLARAKQAGREVKVRCFEAHFFVSTIKERINIALTIRSFNKDYSRGKRVRLG